MAFFKCLRALVALWLLGHHTSGATDAGSGDVAVLNKDLSTAPKAGVWTDTASTPPWLNLHCDTIWTSHTGAYKLPYFVEFSRGMFKWWAPKLDTQEEVGVGKYLSPLRTITREDGSWETFYFGANRFTPNGMDSTNCCCEYVGQPGPGQPHVLADYIVAVVPGTFGVSMQEACSPFFQECPKDNATALQTLGTPFIEIYDPCWQPGGEVASTGEAGIAVFAGVAGGLSLLCLLFRLVWRGLSVPKRETLDVPFLRTETEEINQCGQEKILRSVSRCSTASGGFSDVTRQTSLWSVASNSTWLSSV